MREGSTFLGIPFFFTSSIAVFNLLRPLAYCLCPLATEPGFHAFPPKARAASRLCLMSLKFELADTSALDKIPRISSLADFLGCLALLLVLLSFEATTPSCAACS